jgi:hypothetical protein
MFGLPTEPCALAIRMVDSEVVPQQSFLGQYLRVHLLHGMRTFLVTVL